MSPPFTEQHILQRSIVPFNIRPSKDGRGDAIISASCRASALCYRSIPMCPTVLRTDPFADAKPKHVYAVVRNDLPPSHQIARSSLSIERMGMRITESDMRCARRSSGSATYDMRSVPARLCTNTNAIANLMGIASLR